MFLDYDGTLSPIVDDPDRAFMSDAVCSLIFVLAFSFAFSMALIVWELKINAFCVYVADESSSEERC